MQHRKKVILTP